MMVAAVGVAPDWSQDRAQPRRLPVRDYLIESCGNVDVVAVPNDTEVNERRPCRSETWSTQRGCPGLQERGPSCVIIITKRYAVRTSPEGPGQSAAFMSPVDSGGRRDAFWRRSASSARRGTTAEAACVGEAAGARCVDQGGVPRCPPSASHRASSVAPQAVDLVESPMRSARIAHHGASLGPPATSHQVAETVRP